MVAAKKKIDREREGGRARATVTVTVTVTVGVWMCIDVCMDIGWYEWGKKK